MKLALKPENLAQLVFFIRGEKMMLDSDLAMLYGVSTKALNQAFRRNKQRFPSDFAFQLSKEEFHQVYMAVAAITLTPLRNKALPCYRACCEVRERSCFDCLLLFPAGNHCRLVNDHVGIHCANWRRNVELASPVIPE